MTNADKPTPEQIEANLIDKEQIFLELRNRAFNSFETFYRFLLIKSQDLGDAQIFEECIADFQRKCFDDLTPSIEALRDGKRPPIKRFWIERTKKASKDADLAIIILWLIAFPKRPFYGQVGAGNRDQAAIVKDRVSTLLHENAWLNDYVEIHESKVRSTKKKKDGTPLARLDILAADAHGAHGGTPDLMIINELSHIDDWEFVETLMDNSDGVARGVVIIATNAGKTDGKAYKWREEAISNKEQWCCHFLQEPAPWTSPENLADAERRLPKARFKRLWWGVWESPGGDVLSEETINAAFRLSGPTAAPERDWAYIGGLDLGVKRDHAGACLLGVNQKERRIKVAWMKRWKPSNETGKVKLIEVENSCIEVWKKFRPVCWVYDPSQAELMVQRFQKSGIFTKEMSFSSGSNLTMMANTYVQVMQQGLLECYDTPEDGLKEDFRKFRIEEKPYGTKLESTRDYKGHADLGTSVVIALPAAVSMLESWEGAVEGDLISYNNDLSKEEIAELPEELKELVDSEKEIQKAQDEMDLSTFF